jgi:hypothetical protein
MAVVASATGAAVFGLGAGTLAAGLAGGALLGAGAGALYSGITGDGNILDSALTGALLGGAAGGIGAALAPATAGGVAGATAPLTGTGALAPGAASTVSTATPALTASQMSGMSATQLAGLTPAQLNATAMAQGVLPEGAAQLAGSGMFAAPEVITPQIMAASGASPVVTPPLSFTPKEKLGMGLAGTTALSFLGSRNQPKLSPTTGTTPSYIRPYTYSSTLNTPDDEYPSPYPSTPLYNAQGLPNLDTRERRYFNQRYTAGEPYTAAQGGLMSAGPVERMSQNVMGGSGNMFPLSQIEMSRFSNPTQMPVSAEIIRSNYDFQTSPYKDVTMANGGITYDPVTQRYSGLPAMNSAPAGDSTPLSADLIASLTPQYQAANPNAFSYDPVKQRYGAVNPTMAQLNAFKANQDKIAEEQAATLAAQAYQPYGLGGMDNTGNARGGLMKAYAMGGNIQGYNLGGYSDGGRLLKGPGDGVSDDIPAVIGDRQPARLADGEFVIPARIVSELGNGSTDAGAKRLYAMMDRIQAGRKKTVGKNNVAKDTKAKKHLLA